MKKSKSNKKTLPSNCLGEVIEAGSFDTEIGRLFIYRSKSAYALRAVPHDASIKPKEFVFGKKAAQHLLGVFLADDDIGIGSGPIPFSILETLPKKS